MEAYCRNVLLMREQLVITLIFFDDTELFESNEWHSIKVKKMKLMLHIYCHASDACVRRFLFGLLHMYLSLSFLGLSTFI